MRIKIFLICCVAVSFVALGALLFFYSVEDSVSQVTIAGTELQVIVMDTPELRVQGLSGRESLSQYDAMLFVFPEPDQYGFWMKDMRFAIDIVWIDESMRVIDITKNLTPDTYPQTFKPKFPSMYMLELPAGQAKDEWLGEIIKIR